LFVASTSRPDDAAWRIGHHGTNLRESGAKKQRKFSAARNGEEAEPLRVNFRLCVKPPERCFEVFEGDVMKPRRQRRRAEICERERSETVVREERSLVEIETAA